MDTSDAGPNEFSVVTTIAERITATSTDISMIRVRNCDAPAIKREIALRRSTS